MPAFSFISELRSVVKDAMESSRKVNIIIGVLTDKDVPEDIRRDAEAGGLFILRLADLKDVEQAAQAAADRRTVWKTQELALRKAQVEGETPAPVPVLPARSIKGFVERISADAIRGWAFDSEAPDVHADIDASLDGERLGMAIADNVRPDLKRAGFGEGDYGFVIPLTRHVAADRCAAVVVTARSVADRQTALRHLPAAYPSVSPGANGLVPENVRDRANA
jgi:hypothetical protein